MAIGPTTLRLLLCTALLTACGAPASMVDAASSTHPTPIEETPAPVEQTPDPTAPRATIDTGTLVGRRVDDVLSFQGIPYAAPPVGALRWRPPAPAAAWSGERMAQSFGSRCAQLHEGVVLGSEDCLFLNVWAPAATAAPRPVMVFVHGGGFSTGSASDRADSDSALGGVELYDGRDLAREGDVVVVTIDYRLGLLGFMASPALSAESEHHASGNYGMLDQIAALQWVQRNIAAFGGDPRRVMLFGQSVGGGSVCTQLASPLASGLFSRAAMHSGNCGQGIQTLDVAEARGSVFTAAVGCGDASDVAACMRAQSPAALLTARSPSGNVFKGGPTIDRNFLYLTPTDAFEVGAYNHVPVLIGSNSEETSIDAEVQAITSREQYHSALATWFGAEQVAALSALYPATDGAFAAAFGAATTDDWFTCPAGRSARRLSRGVPVFRFFYTHALSAQSDLGAWHGSELLFLFQRFTSSRFTPTADERSLAATMIRHWTRFAATGDVNEEGANDWPRFSEAQPATLKLDAQTSVLDDVRPTACAYWDMH